MSFLIFRDFSEFNSIYFELNSFKIDILPRGNVAGDMEWMKNHVATWRRMYMPCGVA